MCECCLCLNHLTIAPQNQKMIDIIAKITRNMVKIGDRRILRYAQNQNMAVKSDYEGYFTQIQ